MSGLKTYNLTPEPLRFCWLLLAVAGGLLGIGLKLPDPDASSFVALGTLSAWCALETLVRRNWWAFLTFPAMVLGIGCALPLYLYLRSRRIA